jgi:hypothetical protein
MELDMKNIVRIKLSNKAKIILSAVTVLLMAGCSSTPPVNNLADKLATEQMAVSRAAITTANSAGANEFAPVSLKSANDKMASAERAMGAQNPVLARQLSEQSQVDAQLATATSNAAKAQKVADTLREDNRVLRNEINRTSDH